MHYNAGQRIKPKRRHISIQGVFLVAIFLVVGLALYLALNNSQANLTKPPATQQQPQ